MAHRQVKRFAHALIRTILTGASIGVLLCGFASVGIAATAEQAFRWPEPVVFLVPWDVNNLGPLGVRAVVTPQLKARLERQRFTAEERRNIQTAIDLFSQPRSTPVTLSKKYQPTTGHMGFYVMHLAFMQEFGLPGPFDDGYAVYSIQNRIQTIDHLVAKGDRVTFSFRINGYVAGPLYGYKGVGQVLDLHEQMTYQFDQDGLTLNRLPISELSLSEYQQVGGALKFLPSGVSNLTIKQPIVGGAPWLASEADVAARLQSATYTDRDRRNAEAVFKILATPEGLEKIDTRYLSKTYRPAKQATYAVLDEVYDKPGGFRATSLKSVHRQVVDFLVNGSDMWVRYATTAKQTGPLFGIAPITPSRDLSWYEMAYVTFDDAGKIEALVRRPNEAAIYTQLGGQFIFPYGKYWKCDGCPANPGIAHMDVPAAAQ